MPSRRSYPLVAAFLLGAVAMASAQLSIERTIYVGADIADRSSYVSTLTWTNTGITYIDDVNVQLTLTNASGTTMRLGQMYATLTHGTSMEDQSVAVLLNRPGVSSTNAFGSNLGGLNVWFDDSVGATNVYFITNTTGTYAADGRIDVNPYGTRVPYSTNDITAGLSVFNGDWQNSGTWSLLVADAQSGNRAQFVSWTLRVVGTAATNGTVTPGNGGTISVVGAGTQTLGATVDSTGTGTNAVNLSPGDGAQLTLSGGLSGSGDFRQQTDGIVTLEGDSTNFSGKFVLNAGELQLASSGALGSAGLLEIAGTNTLVRLTESVVISNAISLTNGAPARFDGAGELASAISGLGGLIKEGASTIILSGNSDFGGGVRVLGGTLAVVSDNNLGAGTNSVTFSNNTAAMSFLESFTSTRNFTVAAGTTGTLLAGSGITTTLDGTLSKDGSVLVLGGGGSFTINGTITGASANSDLVVSNSTVTLNTTNSYSGPTYVHTGGILNLGTNNAMPTDTALLLGSGATSGTVNLQGNNQTVASLATQGTAGTNNVVDLGSGLLTVDGSSSTTYAGAIAGSGALVKSGVSTLTLSGANIYSGTTTISNGAISISADNNLGAAPGAATAGHLTLDGGKLLATTGFTLNSNRGISLGSGNGIIEVASGQSVSYAGVAAGTGAFTKSGAGSITFSGANTYTGATTVSAGTLELANASGAALGSTASISVASGATLLISQNLQVNNSAAAVSLSGGTIRTAAGVDEIFGNLTLTTGSFLDFGTTSYANANTISFGSYSYTPSALLLINNFNSGSTLTFTSQLSGAALATFSFTNGGIASTSWDEGTGTFTITAIPEPSTYLAAAGLLGLMLWPSRKRLIKDAKKILGLRAPMRDRLASKRA